MSASPRHLNSSYIVIPKIASIKTKNYYSLVSKSRRFKFILCVDKTVKRDESCDNITCFSGFS